MLNLFLDSIQVQETFNRLPVGATFLFIRSGRESARARKVSSTEVEFTPITPGSSWVRRGDIASYFGSSYARYFEVEFDNTEIPPTFTGTLVEIKIKNLDYRFKNKLLRKVDVTPLPLGA